MKFATDRPYADPEAAARKLIEIANSVEAVQDDRIHIEPDAVRTQSHADGIQRRPQVRDRARLAGDARERHLREVYTDRRGAVRLKEGRQVRRPQTLKECRIWVTMCCKAEVYLP